MENLIKKTWLKYKNVKVKVKKENDKLIITNNSNKKGYIVIPKLFSLRESYCLNIRGKESYDSACTIYIMNKKKEILAQTFLNSEILYNNSGFKKGIIAIKIMPNSNVEIDDLYLDKKTDNFIESSLKSKVLVISPSYPSVENKYLCGFVHSRLTSYRDAGIDFDLVVAHDYSNCCKYEFEGINVLKVPFSVLRTILQTKQYEKILVHFFDYKYANVFDACKLDNTQLYLWVHGPETLYWDWPKFTTPYFSQLNHITDGQKQRFEDNDKLISRYNDMPNVSWIFVSNWIKKESENLINIKFKNFYVIPNIIDSNTFHFHKKSAEDRKKIFFIRRFDDCNKYAIDINVKTILELSRRECFENMEFNIYGTGNVYEKLVAPLKQFSNVKLYKQFFTHSEISKIHSENGIAFFPTRYDAQGVSMCEAAMSGLAVVTSKNDAVMEFLPNDCNIFAETENYIEYANIIENLYNNPKEFINISEKCHQEIAKKCDFKHTVQKEIDLFKKANNKSVKKMENEKCDNKILSVIIPSYNVSQYLEHTVETLLNINNRHKIEIIIVNDGSKDKTIEIANKLAKEYNDANNQIIKIIDKENGGHGSTINEGIKICTGKYTRIIDGDDWVNSIDFEQLINFLEKENSDIVITDYSEDRAIENELIHKKIYDFMVPLVQYHFDDLAYKGYGFSEWGPILATGNFKTEILRKSKYKLSEKSFYVDMEFDFFSIIDAETITYYDLDIYRYFIGRIDQSISKNSFIKNYQQHEKIIFRLLEVLEESNVSAQKRQYTLDKIIKPMIKSHYLILTDFMADGKKFNSFDRKLKKYTFLYNDNFILNKRIKLYRKTKGIIVFLNPALKKISNKLKK